MFYARPQARCILCKEQWEGRDRAGGDKGGLQECVSNVDLASYVLGLKKNVL